MALTPGAIPVIVVSFIATILSMVALVLRLWSKYILRRRMVLHDHMACAAMAFTAGTSSVLLAAGFSADSGLHPDHILATDPAIFAFNLKLFVPTQLLCVAANTCVKISILSLYTSLFPSWRFTLLCYATMAASSVNFFAVLLEMFLLCTPVQFTWDKSIAGTCEGQATAYLIAGISNLVIDVFVLVIPMPMLFGLRMPLRKRLGVVGMFSLGGLICIVSMLRVIGVHNWNRTRVDTSRTTYTGTLGAIYTVLEPTLGVVNACLPTIKPAIIRIIGRQSARDLHPSSKNNSRGLTDSRSLVLPETPDRLYVRGSDFNRLDDDITLVNIRSEPLAGTNSSNTSADGHITVCREWAVRSG